MEHGEGGTRRNVRHRDCCIVHGFNCDMIMPSRSRSKNGTKDNGGAKSNMEVGKQRGREIQPDDMEAVGWQRGQRATMARWAMGC